MNDTWLDVAVSARRSASQLMRDAAFRSAASRAYYAAYSKLTHELVAAGVTMPREREGPGHQRLRPLIETPLTIMTKAKRVVLSALVGRLYILRLDADYRPSAIVEAREARLALSIMNKIFDAT